MRKLLAVVISAAFAAVSFNVLAASHAGAQKMEKGEVKTKDGKAVTTKKEGKKVETKEEKKK